MLVLDVREGVEQGLDGARVPRDVHEVARHYGPEGRDAPGCAEEEVEAHDGADGGDGGGDGRPESVFGRGRDVVVGEAVAEEAEDQDEGRHGVEALGLEGGC